MKNNKIILSDTAQGIIESLAIAAGDLNQAINKINEIVSTKDFETVSNLLDLTNWADDMNYIENLINDLNNMDYKDLTNTTQTLYKELDDISYEIEIIKNNVFIHYL